MAYPEDMVYCRLDFTAGADEIQNTGFWARVEGASGVDFTWSDFVNNAAEKIVQSWHDDFATAAFSPYITAQRCVVYHYSQDHKTVLDRGEAAFTGDNAWAGSGTTALPPQVSLVLSLYGYDPATFVANRQHKRGRMYLPTHAGGNTNVDTATGTFSDVSGLLGQCADFWADLQGPIDTGLGDHANLQPVISSSFAGGTVTDADWLRMGRVFDTQRRRRNKLSENYQTAHVT